MSNLVRDTALMLLIAFLLFVAVNAGAWLYLGSLNSNDRGGLNWQINPQSARGIEIRKKVFATEDTEFLRSLDGEPRLVPHTILQFSNGDTTAAYEIGIQDIRYENEWTDDYVEKLLRSGEAVFVFGGSTTFGQGVPADGTVVHFLNKKNPDQVYVNFGINAYDSLREVDKLLYLLRQGYRPRAVVFIDGLNDITTFISTPYRAVDKPRTQGFLINRGDTTLIMGTPVPANMLLAFAYSLPISHLYYQLTNSDPDVPYGSLNANKDRLSFKTLAWYYKNQFEYGHENIDAIAEDWVNYYANNIAFVQELASAFGFDTTFVFQPFGIMDRGNPFLTQEYFGSIGFEISEKFTGSVTDAISRNKLEMSDCQNAFADMDSELLWVDATHYSPTGNSALADCILEARQQ